MKKQKAFTLIEVVIALGILASVLMVLTSSWRGNIRRVKKAKVQTQVAYLLQQKMTEIETFYADNVASLPTDKQTGEFKEYKQFKWEWEANEFTLPDLSRILVTEEGTVDQTKLYALNTMRDYLEKSIKEVKLTVIYRQNPKAKPVKYSVATVLVDYNIPLNIGPPSP